MLVGREAGATVLGDLVKVDGRFTHLAVVDVLISSSMEAPALNVAVSLFVGNNVHGLVQKRERQPVIQILILEIKLEL